MRRPRVGYRVLLLAVSFSSPLAVACSSASPEQQVLIDFFRASRLHDNTTLANIATISFDPRTDGSVQKFSIASIGSERRRPLQIQQFTGQGARVLELGAAVDSLTPPGQPDVDVSTMDVELISKDVTVNADVRTPEGRTTPKTLVCTLQRAVATQHGQTRSGRWIVTDVAPRT